MSKPTFIGAGGQKCASTWLSECIRYHPQAYVSDVKEIEFFHDRYDMGLDWYLGQFADAPDSARAVGEFSTHYVYDPESPARIKRDLGDVRIVIAVRNPIDRFVSHYWHNVRTGRFDKDEYGALDLQRYESAIARTPSLLGNGLFSAGIRRFQETFGADHVLVVVKDDIDRDPAGTIKAVYRFLGLDDSVKPDVVDKQVGKGIVPKSFALEKLRVFLYHLCKRVNPKLITFVKQRGLSDKYREANAAKRALDASPEVLAALDAYYADEIAALSDLLRRDLRAWRYGGKK